MLDASFQCLDAGDHIGAGVRIRQAARLLLIAIAEHYGLKKPLHKYPRPARIARVLHSAGKIDASTLQTLLGLISVCNATAHCEEVVPTALRDAADQVAALFASTVIVDVDQQETQQL